MAAQGGGVRSSHEKPPSLIRAEDETKLVDEIAGSKKRIEEELGTPVWHFCCPNGDYDERLARLLGEAGFASAVTVQRSLNSKKPNLFPLRRIRIEPDWPDADFRHYATGSPLRAVRGL